MRYHGRITRWKDDRGFGFIRPRHGGDDVFVHISSFANRNRRPIENEVVTYTLQVDAKGRLQAWEARPVDDQGQRAKPSLSQVAGAVLIAGICIGVIGGLIVASRLPVAVLGLYGGASAAAFVVYARDKSAAQQNAWRVSENTLLLLGLAGGWPGALVARHVLRHKSKKQPFIALFWGTVILNGGALIWLLSGPGQELLASLLGAT